MIEGGVGMKFFDCSSFVKPEMVQEPLPSNKES